MPVPSCGKRQLAKQELHELAASRGACLIDNSALPPHPLPACCKAVFSQSQVCIYVTVFNSGLQQPSRHGLLRLISDISARSGAQAVCASYIGAQMTLHTHCPRCCKLTRRRQRRRDRTCAYFHWLPSSRRRNYRGLHSAVTDTQSFVMEVLVGGSSCGSAEEVDCILFRQAVPADTPLQAAGERAAALRGASALSSTWARCLFRYREKPRSRPRRLAFLNRTGLAED